MYYLLSGKTPAGSIIPNLSSIGETGGLPSHGPPEAKIKLKEKTKKKKWSAKFSMGGESTCGSASRANSISTWWRSGGE